MYFFDKKTMYLVWDMQEGQARGVGTVKFLAIDEVCRIEAVVTDCGKVQGTYPVYVLSGDMESLLGEMTLNKGKGNFYIKCTTSRLGHSAFPYTHVTGVRIDLHTEGTLEQKWLPVQEIPESIADRDEEKTESGKNREELVKTQEKDAEKDQIDCDETYKEEQEGVNVKPPEKKIMSLYPNKWQQLCAIYPVVHPFQDGRAYLSIEPRDFVILQERYQPMVQNSFLLHGFYHYKHLLLGRHQQGKSIRYYIGVPGVFYEKEKAAALFYGFEGFEGAVTPSKEGSFGYYLKQVQI